MISLPARRNKSIGEREEIEEQYKVLGYGNVSAAYRRRINQARYTRYY